jgi:hypothetical protein
MSPGQHFRSEWEGLGWFLAGCIPWTAVEKADPFLQRSTTRRRARDHLEKNLRYTVCTRKVQLFVDKISIKKVSFWEDKICQQQFVNYHALCKHYALFNNEQIKICAGEIFKYARERLLGMSTFGGEN